MTDFKIKNRIKKIDKVLRISLPDHLRRSELESDRENKLPISLHSTINAIEPVKLSE